MNAAWIVLRKELTDALRDRRTLFMVLVSSVAMGPLVLVLLSTLVAGVERRAEARQLVARGLEHAPALRNYIERQTYTVSEPPPDFRERLANNQLGEPVLVVPADFTQALERGEVPVLELYGSSGNQRASTSMARVQRLLEGFGREQLTLRLALRGIPPSALQVVDVEERDVADPAARAARMTVMVPFFVLMAMVYGALTAALDTTAGERERGSLEPLLTNPAPRWALVLGKWAAVSCVSILIAVLSCGSFLPGQWLLRSETLSAMFRFGPGEAAAFIGLLLPLAGALAALLMAIAIRCRTFREAQASATIVVLAVALLPMVTLFNEDGERPWHLLAPGLAQATLMGRVLRGEGVGSGEVALTVAVSGLIVGLAVAFVARHLRRATV